MEDLYLEEIVQLIPSQGLWLQYAVKEVMEILRGP